MSLQSKVTADLKYAMQNGTASEQGAARRIRSRIQFEIAKHELGELEDHVVMALIKEEMKVSLGIAIQYELVNRVDLAQMERKEAECMASYLPPKFPMEKVRKIAETTILEIQPSGHKDLGKVMGKVMSRLKGENVEGREVADLVQSLLN